MAACARIARPPACIDDTTQVKLKLRTYGVINVKCILANIFTRFFATPEGGVWSGSHLSLHHAVAEHDGDAGLISPTAGMDPARCMLSASRSTLFEPMAVVYLGVTLEREHVRKMLCETI